MFPILIKEENVKQEISLTVEQKKALTDVFVVSDNLNDFIHKCATAECLYGLDVCTNSYNKKEEISQKVIEIMKGLCVKDIVDEVTVFYPIPTTKTALVTLAYSFFPDCYKESFQYNIDMIVKWSNGKGTTTWTDFVNYFKS